MQPYVKVAKVKTTPEFDNVAQKWEEVETEGSPVQPSNKSEYIVFKTSAKTL